MGDYDISPYYLVRKFNLWINSEISNIIKK